MPMIPETIVSMLACARIGAVHCVVFGGFASKELAVRIDDAGAKLIISASCGIEPSRKVPYKPLLDDAIDQARLKPEHCIVLQRSMLKADLIVPRDLDWHDVLADAEPVDCVEVESNHPLYILYTSGTTGQPKGIVRDTGGYIVALKWSMSNIYNVKPGDVYWAENHLNIPVIDHWWQTETGWSICANCLGIEELPVVPGSPGRPVPRYEVSVLGADGNAAVDGDIGALLVRLPLPPGNFTTLWNADDRFRCRQECR